VGRSKPGFASEHSVWRLFTQDRPGSGQARDALIAHGFSEETMQQDDGLSVYVRDPDGNKIELYGKRTEVEPIAGASIFFTASLFGCEIQI